MNYNNGARCGGSGGSQRSMMQVGRSSRGVIPPPSVMFTSPQGGTRHAYASTGGSMPNMTSGRSGCGYQRPTISMNARSRTRNQNQCGFGPNPAAMPNSALERQMQRMCGGAQGRTSCVKDSPAAKNPYKPDPNAAIMVNISADQIANAQCAPSDPCRASDTGGNNNVKYIPLSWDAILGKTGMDGMRVSMLPCGEGPNRQLKVAFGGQNVTNQPGEQALKVVSIQPAFGGKLNNEGSNPAAVGMDAMNMTVGGQLANQQRRSQQPCRPYQRQFSCPSNSRR